MSLSPQHIPAISPLIAIPSVVASSKDNYALKFYNIAGAGEDEDDE